MKMKMTFANWPRASELTREQTGRIAQAILETDAILNRARRYSPEFQDKAMIAKYEAHKAKLVGMLTED
jgi:hypothetical protein